MATLLAHSSLHSLLALWKSAQRATGSESRSACSFPGKSFGTTARIFRKSWNWLWLPPVRRILRHFSTRLRSISRARYYTTNFQVLEIRWDGESALSVYVSAALKEVEIFLFFRDYGAIS